MRVLVALVVGLVACSDGATTVTYEPYAGPPVYPDRRPKLPPPKGYFGFVADSLSDTVSVLDLPSAEVVTQIPVGREPVGIDGPHRLAVDAEGNVYIALSYPRPTTDPGPHASHSSGARPGYVQKLAAADLHVIGEVKVEANPGEIIVTPDSKKLIVTHFDVPRALNAQLDAEEQKAAIVILDPSSLALSGTPAPITVRPCRAPHGASVAADSKTIYVACYADDTLAILDVATPAAAPTIVPVGAKAPYSAVLSGSGRFVAIGATEGKETRIFDTQSKTMKERGFPTLGAPYFASWALDESKLWIPTQGPDAIVVVDATTGAVLKQRAFDDTCQKPHEAVLAKDGSALYLVCEGDHVAAGAVLVLDPSTLETRSSMKVGVYPDRLAFGRGP